ncbi:MAG: hypothetical protein MJ080_02260, partial [Clostridia bacterium]|nr:hypothetical protein [Clostridia bacterium]
INGEITFSGSVFAYCNSVMSKDGQTDAAKNAMAAFFEYYSAAKEYAKLFVFPHHSTLDEYTWEELKTVSNAISEGTISDEEMAHFETFTNEAQTKKVVLDNGDALYVRIIGFNHDALCADTTQKAGITFMAVNSLNHGYYSGNEGSDESTYAVGWAAVNGSSPLREKMQQYGEIYKLLPDELTKQIQQVQKQSREGWVSEETYSSTLICTDDYLFLLSGDEIGTDEFNPEGKSDTEGTEYEYINCSVYPDNWTTDSGVLFLNINAKGYEFIKEHIAEYDDFSEMRYAIMDAGGFVECDYNNCSILRSVANDCYDYCGAVYFNGFIMKNHVWMSSCVAPCFCI